MFSVQSVIPSLLAVAIATGGSLAYATAHESEPLVRSSASGTVIFARSMLRDEQCVIVREGAGQFRAYLGLDRVLVKRDERVQAGTDLGAGSSISIREFHVNPSGEVDPVQPDATRRITGWCSE